MRACILWVEDISKVYINPTPLHFSRPEQDWKVERFHLYNRHLYSKTAVHSRQTALQIYMLRGFMPNSCISLSLRLVNLGNESGILLLENFFKSTIWSLISWSLCSHNGGIWIYLPSYNREISRDIGSKALRITPLLLKFRSSRLYAICQCTESLLLCPDLYASISGGMLYFSSSLPINGNWTRKKFL